LESDFVSTFSAFDIFGEEIYFPVMKGSKFYINKCQSYACLEETMHMSEIDLSTSPYFDIGTSASNQVLKIDDNNPGYFHFDLSY